MNDIDKLATNCQALIASTKETGASADLNSKGQALLDLINGATPLKNVEEINYLTTSIKETYEMAVMKEFINRATIFEIYNSGELLAQLPEQEVLFMVSERSSNRIVLGKKIGNGIFLGHGRSRLYARVQTFLMDDFNIHAHTFERHGVGGQQVIPTLQGLLDECGFAIIVATAEDKSEDGLHARQNVVHETGLFQGRLGFDRVAILRQRETKEYTNLSGFLDFPFDGENIEATFYGVSKQMRSFGYAHL